MSASMGLPDLGIMTIDDVCFFIRQIARVSGMPMLVDGDTGFGEALNVMQMVRAFEDAGAGVLVEAAREAARHAHAPYSKFAVGAALLMTDGTIVTGTNFENASYGLSLCAETVAIAAANAAGRLADVVAIGVIGGAMDAAGRATGSAPVRPCGRCRQLLFEHGGPDLLVDAPDGPLDLAVLLPGAFGPGDLPG